MPCHVSLHWLLCEPYLIYLELNKQTPETMSFGIFRELGPVRRGIKLLLVLPDTTTTYYCTVPAWTLSTYGVGS